MRMRKKKHGAERIAACSDLLITDFESLRRDPNSLFDTQRPIRLEIGCGKGDFACGISEQNPDINIIAMEKVSDVACLALEKAKARECNRSNNLKFIIGDAKNLTEWFPPHSLDGIYLNFSDPWPKAGYKKRRLTYRAFLEAYRSILRENGRLVLKTDNKDLFAFSLEEFEACGLNIEWHTEDLHNSEHGKNNVMTEYERNFTAKGFTICSASVVFPKKKQADTE